MSLHHHRTYRRIIVWAHNVRFRAFVCVCVQAGAITDSGPIQSRVLKRRIAYLYCANLTVGILFRMMTPPENGEWLHAFGYWIWQFVSIALAGRYYAMIDDKYDIIVSIL